jgi:hypothetical protein
MSEKFFAQSIPMRSIMLSDPAYRDFNVWICLFMSKGLHSELEQNTRAFLDNLQQKGGPPIYTLLPYDARAVLSGLQILKD